MSTPETRRHDGVSGRDWTPGRGLVGVRVVTRGLGLSVLATAAAVVYLAGSPVPEIEAADRCDGLRGYVRALAVHPDGSRVSACSSDGSLTLWEPGSGLRGSVRAGGDGGRCRVALAADGSALVVAERDPSVTIRDGMTGRLRVRLEAAGPVRALAFRGDGTLVALADEGGVQAWDAETGRRAGPRLELRGTCCLAFAPDGRTLAVGCRDGTVRLWDPAGGGPPEAFRAHKLGVWSLAFAADGRVLATTGRQGTAARLWEPGTGRLLAELDGRTSLQLVAFSPGGGPTLATAGLDGAVRVWDAATGRLRQVVPGGRGAVTALAFSPGGDALVCGGTGSIWCCRVADATGS